MVCVTSSRIFFSVQRNAIKRNWLLEKWGGIANFGDIAYSHFPKNKSKMEDEHVVSSSASSMPVETSEGDGGTKCSVCKKRLGRKSECNCAK